MKIGILTFYKVPNYGAMLQAYALWHYLRARGHDVCFIDYAFQNTIRIPLWRCFLSRSVKSTIAKLNFYCQFGITSFAESYPQTKRYATYESLCADPPRCDAYVVGSDQMWNPKYSMSLLDVVFLNFAPHGVPRISYAASFGQDHWGKQSRIQVGDLLRKFSAISVREKSGVGIVDRVATTDAVCLVDPTLLLKQDFYLKSISGLDSNKAPENQPQKRLFVYYLDEWKSGSSYERQIVDNVLVCLEGNAKISSPFKNIKGVTGGVCNRLGIKSKESVQEWIHDIQTADFVLTNSFHGTVFSLIFHRPFLTVSLLGGAADMNDRAQSLLEAVGLRERLLDEKSIGKIPELVDRPIDWELVDKYLEAEREKTGSFFKKLGL